MHESCKIFTLDPPRLEKTQRNKETMEEYGVWQLGMALDENGSCLGRVFSFQICSNVASRPIILHPNKVKSLPAACGSSVFLWACELGNNECINSQNPTPTMAEFNIGNDSNSYMLSAENGYNFPIRIMSLSDTNRPAITCAGNLDDCPKELQILNSSGAVVACRPPDSGSAQLFSLYSSMVANCQTPGSSYDPSSIGSTCPSSIYLVARFIEN